MQTINLNSFKTAAAAVICLLSVPADGLAQSVQRIAAIVNDELITAYDLESRLKLVILSTRLPNTIETRRRIGGQVLRTLIDERLQLQEAQRRNISVSKRDLRRAKSRIEKQNKLPKDSLERVLRQNKVPFDVMEQQLRAGIAWSKLLGRRLRPRIIIGEDEVDEALDRIKARQGQTEYRLTEILLAVDGPDEEDNVRRTAERIRGQVQNGANFEAIARQFSQSATAAVGGDLGWVHEAELGEDVREIVPKLQRGVVSKPVKTIIGYRLLMLRDIRKIAETQPSTETVDLRQIFLPLPGAASQREVEAQIDLAKTVRETATSCADFGLIAKEIRSPRPPNLGRFAMSDLSPSILAAVRNVPAGKISNPVKMPGGVLVLMVCSREGVGGEIKLPDRSAVADRLMQKRLSLMARRYMRDIRLSAVIDIRV